MFLLTRSKEVYMGHTHGRIGATVQHRVAALKAALGRLNCEGGFDWSGVVRRLDTATA